MRAQDLAALAALGAVGFHLSQKGKDKKDDKIDASPEKSSRQENDVPDKLSRQERDVPEKVVGGMRPQDVTQGGDTGNRSVAPKPAVAKNQGSGGIRPQDVTQGGGSTSDKVAAPAPKATFSSSEAGMKKYVPRRTGQTPSAVQTSSTARKDDRPYVGSLKGSGEKSMMDKYRESDMAKGFQDAREKLGDYPTSDAIMDAGKAGMLMAATRGRTPLKSYSQPLLGGPAGKPALGGPGTAALPAPAKQLTGPSKTDLMARDRAERASSRGDAMTRENADRYGLNPAAPGYDAAASSLRNQIGGRDFTLKKNGGAIKKMASGGMTSRSTSASSRGDGIAQRGKTKGMMR